MIFPILSILIFGPILGGSLILCLGQRELRARSISLLFSIFSLCLCFYLFLGFDNSAWALQFVEKHAWIPSMDIQYTVGVDGFSLPLIILTCFMTLLVILASYASVSKFLKQYLSAFLIMQGLITGALAAMDGILFYLFWEGMLIPMFIIIGIWGGQNRLYATMKFFLYTFLGSVLLLVSLIYLHHKTASFDILAFQHLALDLDTQKMLFMAFLIAFAVKVPMWPIHTWLPDAHVEAPTGGSVILAAILLKMGGYGFLRFMLPIVPEACRYFSSFIILLSLIAITYIALLTIIQKDMKKLIAYSSIAHMGFVTLGFFLIFALNGGSEKLVPAMMGLSGGMIQMISHGFVSAALFLCVGVLYDRMHTRMITDYQGIANVMPKFAAFFMLFSLANVGLPGTSGFVGEFLVILSSYQASITYALLAGSILVLGAGYTLWMYKRVVFGEVGNQKVATLQDIRGFEILIFVLLSLAILWLGLWPAPFLDMVNASSNHLAEQLLNAKT